MKKMSTVKSLYYDRYGSYDCPNTFLAMKPLKEVKKNASLESLTTNKISTGLCLYYDGYDSYDFRKIQFFLMQISPGSSFAS